MSVVNAGLMLSAPSGYTIDRSLRFRSSASAYLSRTPASAGNRKTFTWSGWVKLGATISAQGALFSARTDDNNRDNFQFTSSTIQIVNVVSGSATTNLVTTQVFRDPSAWYHILFAVDTTQATSSNRVKVYVNGVQVTSFSTATYPSLNDNFMINAAVASYLGVYGYSTLGGYFDGYLTEVNFIDGQALDPTSFGEYNSDTGVWQPIKYTGAYGTNGFYLNFSDNSTTTTLGYDTSGQGNNWTANNISVTSGATYDSMTDVPTLTSEDAGNYAVLNGLAKSWSNSGTGTTSNGNLQIAYSSGNWYGHKSTIAVTSGKWYYEVTNVSAGIYAACGISLVTVGAEYSSGIYKYRSNAEIYNTSYASYGATWSTAGDVCGVAFDLDAGTITFYKNGVSQGTAFTGIPTGVYAAEVIVASGTAVANFGQRPFAYTPPAGFKSLNTYNLPDSTIVDGSQYFNTVLYTGTGTTHAITGVGFQPSWVWGKSRNTANSHSLYDAVRGTGLELFTDTTDEEVDRGTSSGVQSFDSDGFTLEGAGNLNTNTNPYVVWNWKANGSGVTNNEGTIESTVSANPTAGFSIVSYTANGTSAQTIGHGLNDVPAMIITKVRNNTGGNWGVYHKSIGNTGAVFLNVTNGTATSSLYWNNTTPTSSVFSVGSNNTDTNWSTYNFVAYCFAEVEGYSKFGSYTGNNSASDGTFVYLGFRPRFLMIKSTSAGTEWVMIDTERNQYNLSDTALYANRAYSEATITAVNDIDILSNGFKLRNNTGYVNASQTYIYMAFAENPFKNALAR